MDSENNSQEEDLHSLKIALLCTIRKSYNRDKERKVIFSLDGSQRKKYLKNIESLAIDILDDNKIPYPIRDTYFAGIINALSGNSELDWLEPSTKIETNLTSYANQYVNIIFTNHLNPQNPFQSYPKPDPYEVDSFPLEIQSGINYMKLSKIIDLPKRTVEKVKHKLEEQLDTIRKYKTTSYYEKTYKDKTINSLESFLS